MVRVTLVAVVKCLLYFSTGSILTWMLLSNSNVNRTLTRHEAKCRDTEVTENTALDNTRVRDSYVIWNYTWDGGLAEFTRSNAEVRWRTLYFVRHGHYHTKGDKASHLTEIGKKQAQLVGQRLQSLGLNFSRTETSTSPRAMETANIMAGVMGKKIVFKPNPDIREGWPIMPQPTNIYPNRTEKSIQWEKVQLSNAYRKLFTRPPPGIYKDNTELFVCHGNIISYFVLRSLQVPIERFLRLVIQQASITAIDINSKGLFKVRMVGDVGHLPHDLWTHQ